MTCIARPDAEVQHPVNLTGASGWPVFSAVRSPTTLFVGALYLSPMAGSSSLSWPFYIDIAILVSLAKGLPLISIIESSSL